MLIDTRTACQIGVSGVRSAEYTMGICAEIHVLAETIEPLQPGRLPTVRSHDYH